MLSCQSLIDYKNSLILKDSLKLSKYNYKNKTLYLNFLPRVSYDAFNNSVNLSVNFSNVTRFFQKKKENEIQKEILRSELEYKRGLKIEKLEKKILQYKFLIEDVKNSFEALKISQDLYKIDKSRYNKTEITTKDFLKIKLAFMREVNNLKSKIKNLKLKEIELKNKIEIKINTNNIEAEILKINY